MPKQKYLSSDFEGHAHPNLSGRDSLDGRALLLPQFYIQFVYKAPLFITLRIKIWAVAYFYPPKIQKINSKKIKYKRDTMQLFSADAIMFKKIICCPQKVEKPTLKSC